MRLTNRQAEALIKLRDHGPRCAYPGLHIGTLNALSLRKLVSAQHNVGSIAMPHTSIVWSITDAGRLALQQAEEGK
jgi:hypothetical protein